LEENNTFQLLLLARNKQMLIKPILNWIK